jgi:hypothetical protein
MPSRTIFFLPFLGLCKALSHSITSRQDVLLINEVVCFNTDLQGSILRADCATVNFVPGPATIDLNRCINNDEGQLRFDSVGNAFDTCFDCKLVEFFLSCTCKTSAGTDRGAILQLGISHCFLV